MIAGNTEENLFQRETRKHLAQWPKHPAVVLLLRDLRPFSNACDIDDAITVINCADASLNAWLVAHRSDAPGPDHDAWAEGCVIMGQMRNARVAFWKLPGVV